uniref:hypothetical protein n=1 Tax=Acetatifactor sp. TaxID=1872090 RepID=UPI004055F7A7
MMRKLLSYVKSHIYDIHAIIVSVIVFGCMMYIKKPIKKLLEQGVDRMMENNPRLVDKRKLYVKRANLLLILLTFILSIMGFGVVSLLSPFIDFSFQSAVMAGVYALCEYAFFEQVTNK